ncbi:MAG: hypothetical protein N3I35_08020 [Clostridia bacterium]|nr:hypothetical protein [Clostridia bacterium]
MAKFSTIKHNNTLYHGFVLRRYERGFTFGFRMNDRNYIWECDYDYWELIN